jgi:hypothetical protein
VITLVRLGLSESTDELVKNLAYVPKSLLVGTIGALTYACLPLGFSALFAKPNLNLAVWAGFYVLLTTMIAGFAMYAKIPALGAVDPVFALVSLSHQLFDVRGPAGQELAPLAAAATALLAYSALGAGIAYLRVNAGAHVGIGGGS